MCLPEGLNLLFVGHIDLLVELFHLLNDRDEARLELNDERVLWG